MLFRNKNKKDERVSMQSSKLAVPDDVIQEMAQEGISFDEVNKTMGLLFTLLYVLGFVVIVEMGVIWHLATKPTPKPDFYAADQYGNNYRLSPIDKPNLSMSSVQNFASDKVGEIMSFSFTDMDNHLDGKKAYFTNNGWLSFYQAMKKSGFTRIVAENREIVQSALKGAIVTTRLDTKSDVMAWRVEVPVQVHREAIGKQPKDSEYIAVLTIVHIKKSEYDRGLAIDGFEWKPKERI